MSAVAHHVLHPDLTLKLRAVRAKRAFDVSEWINHKCRSFNDYMAKSGLTGCVVSMSGGVDSATTLGLMKRAQSMDGSPIERVLGISQPIHSSGWAYDRAHEAAEVFEAEIITVDQTAIFDTLKATIDEMVCVTGEQFAGGQLRSYMRAPVGYYVAQLLSQNGTPSIVMGTGHKDAEGYLAYYCKAGDGVVDVQLIADLHKSQVFAVAEEVGVPQSILTAPPSADLWDGHTDENELGLTYDFIELWTNYLELSEGDKIRFRDELCEEALRQFNSWGQAAESIHRRNAHKFNSPLNL